MRTTVTIDDSLLKEAQALSGLKENGPLIKAALEALIQREAALRLARLGGSQPDLQEVPRRRPPISGGKAKGARRASLGSRG